MAKQTSVPRRGTRGNSRLATPDRLDTVQNASWELSAIGECLAAIGRDLELVPCDQKPPAGGTGNALNWLASEIDRRCALIDEALS
ncbi:hypothetical protein predicted by Glimmer/Critica [Acetobacter senegalensis]|uniref:Uncharacterized protein n=1 Tax=Acetobacter senegalensis TaxID=446692 RepID=A0A0U5FK74_9PROT|nr:hypothetical protein [Acetobacter senegalensis]CEF40205.1 hypothetical protein predicted by Glimmer/Critica [Acetobacter senegalensis]